jgi:adenosylmethionine-8-amino-7-oxononanoate aminotransferase
MSGRVPPVLEYRCPNPGHPAGCAQWHANALDAEIERLGPDRVAAFIAEPVGGAASGAAVPPEGYWAAVAEICKTHGVLLIADEVMTGFGRTGHWFASLHFDLKPDIMTLAKGASSGYWPLGICAMSGEVASALAGTGFVHGFTFSHHLVGAAAGMAVIQRMDDLHLVAAAESRGNKLVTALRDSVSFHPAVGDVRGIGLMLAVELVADRETKKPFPRESRAAEKLTNLAKEEGLLVYPSTGSAGHGEGDLIMIGPPLIINDQEIDMLVSKVTAAVGRL